MAQRISRAKRALQGRRLDQPGDLAVVLRVLYLVYTAGHAGRVDLAGEAIRLARQLTLATEEPEARGLLALMLLNHARLPARLDSEGRIVTLDRQDRGLWDTREIAEGVRVLQSALAVQRPGRYQVEAAIAALHDDAASAEETDWPQILAWYDDLVALTDDPVRQDPAAVLGRAVAVGHVLGAAAGLRETDRLREVLGERHRWHAVRGHLHELSGDLPAAATAYADAARRATDVAERDHLVRQAARAGPRSYVGTVVSLSVLHRLAYPAMTRLSRATHRWSLQTNGRRVPTSRSATERRCSWGRRVATVERMTIQRMEHVGIVVDDLAAATAFFVELGLKLQGEGPVEGGWVDRVVGLEGVRAEIAMVETPDGHGRLELTKFHAPSGRGGDRHAPANTPGIRHVAFAVDDIDAVVASLRARGAELVGEVERYEDSYRLCYVRGPEGIIVELAEQIG
jgi:catechol 2,3-dioxygenase-like lactoylglutathione lyase family enzyme